MGAVITGAIIAGICTLLGVIISGVINYRLNCAQFERETKRQQQQLIREKIEEIYLTIEEISFIEHDIIGQMMALNFTKKIPEINRTDVPVKKLNMLIYLYAPQLSPLLDLVEELGKTYSLLLFEYIATWVKQKPNELLFEKAMKGHDIAIKIYHTIETEASKIISNQREDQY